MAVHIRIPTSFYGAGYAVCAILFFVSFMSNVSDAFREAGIGVAALLFFIVTAVYVWDRDKYYEDLKGRV
jgi:Ca2+-dependent lipid-binding protein